MKSRKNTNFKSPQLLAMQLSSTSSFTFFSNCLIFSSELKTKQNKTIKGLITTSNVMANAKFLCRILSIKQHSDISGHN